MKITGDRLVNDIETKFLRKICPKCRGNNVYLDSDEYGWYELCIQCGYHRDLQNLREVQKRAGYAGTDTTKKVVDR